MRAVAVHLNALDILSENIARNVAALVNYKALFARLGGFVGKHSAVQPGANDQIIIHGLFMHSFCARPKPKQVFVIYKAIVAYKKEKCHCGHKKSGPSIEGPDWKALMRWRFNISPFHLVSTLE